MKFSPREKVLTAVNDVRVFHIKLFQRRCLAQGEGQRLVVLEQLPPALIRSLPDVLAAADVIRFGAKKILGVDSGSHDVEARVLVGQMQPEEERRHQLAQTIRNSGILALGADERVAVVDVTRFVILQTIRIRLLTIAAVLFLAAQEIEDLAGVASGRSARSALLAADVSADRVFKVIVLPNALAFGAECDEQVVDTGNSAIWKMG